MKNEQNIVIRPPLPGELGWIVQVHGKYYAEKFGWLGEFECIVAKIIVEYLSFENSKKQACFIAEFDGNPVGCIMLMEETETEGKLRVMFVSENARRMGAGSLLINYVFEKAKQFNYKTLNLWTTNNQKAARELYKKIGFSLVSETPNTTFAKGSSDELWQIKL